MFWQILPSILLYVWFLEGFDLLKIYIPYVYICIYLYIPHNEFITSWTSMFNETVSKDTEILLPSLGLIKYIHGMIHLLYCRHWTDKRKYIPYISVTHKVLKSCRSKMATLAHDVYDMHGAFSLYIKTCCQSLYRVSLLLGGMGESPHQPKICSFTPSPPNLYSLPPKVNST